VRVRADCLRLLPPLSVPASLVVAMSRLRWAPFARRDAFGPTACDIPLRDRLLLVAFWCTLLPLFRLAALFVAVVSFCCFCLALAPAPLKLRYALLPPLARVHGRFALLCCGFWPGCIKRRGVRHQAAPVLVCNHVSWLDILVLLSEACPAFIAKASVQRLPLIGVIARTLDCVFAERENGRAGAAGAGAAVLERLRRHQPEAPPLAVFPEGTTTNGAFLLPFKTGAFLGGVPVQPVLLHYRVRRFSPAFETIDAMRSVLLVLSQPRLELEITYLPLCTPDAAEAAQPALFAQRVRAEMLAAGAQFLQPSHLTLRDKFVYHEILKSFSWAETLETLGRRQ